MTPFEKLGYKVGDKFEVVGASGFVSVKDGDIVVLYRDDKSNFPLFQTKNGSIVYLYAENIRPLKTEAEKRGVKFGVGGVIKATGEKWVFAKDIGLMWRGIAENGNVYTGEPHQFRLDHEPEYREIPFSEATHEQRMDVSALRFDGGPVEQIFCFDNGVYAFTVPNVEYICIAPQALTVRIPT